MQNSVIIEPKEKATHAVIWLHGLGADGHDFTPLVPELNLANTRFIFPHAPVRSVTFNGGNPMRAWFDIHGLELNSHVDWEGLAETEKRVHQLIDAQRHIGIPANNIYIAGFSQGGMVALYTMLRYPIPLAGAIGLSTVLPISFNLTSHPASKQTPIFLAHGKTDPLIPFQLAELVSEWLEKQDYKLEWHLYNIAHTVSSEEIGDLNRWFQRNQK